MKRFEGHAKEITSVAISPDGSYALSGSDDNTMRLWEISTGKEVIMTGVYDEMTERSYPDYEGGTNAQRQMRDILRNKMEANGFVVYEFEWWHFDYNDWKTYRIENIPFSEIK